MSDFVLVVFDVCVIRCRSCYRFFLISLTCLCFLLMRVASFVCAGVAFVFGTEAMELRREVGAAEQRAALGSDEADTLAAAAETYKHQAERLWERCREERSQEQAALASQRHHNEETLCSLCSTGRVDTYLLLMSTSLSLVREGQFGLHTRTPLHGQSSSLCFVRGCFDSSLKQCVDHGCVFMSL